MEEHWLVSGDSDYEQVVGFCDEGNENIRSKKLVGNLWLADHQIKLY
jgi:hypothetical protein